MIQTQLLKIGNFNLKLKHLLILVVLILSFSISLILRSQVLDYGYELNEFDPFFNFRATEFLVNNGLFEYLDWHDVKSWYPNGRDISATSQVMLHVTAAITYQIFGSSMELYDFTILFPGIIGALTTIVIFALVRTIGGTTAGLFGSLLFAISVPIIIRGSMGWFKSEPLGLFYGLFGLYLFLSGIKSDNKKITISKLIGGGVFLAFGLASWGGIQFFIIPIGIFIFALPFVRKDLGFLIWGIPVFVVSLLLTTIMFERPGIDFVLGLGGFSIILPTIFLIICKFTQKFSKSENQIRNCLILLLIVILIASFIIILNMENQFLQYPVSLVCSAPSYQLVSSFIFDGDNGALDPGESADIQLVIENNGSAPLSYPTFTMYANDDYLTMGTINQDNAYYWETSSSIVLNLDITVSNAAPIGHTSIVWINIGSLNTNYNYSFALPMTIGMLIEGFEGSDFSGHNWQMDGDSDWFIQDDEVYDGNYAAKSGDVGNNQSSEISVEYNVLHQGSINFFAKVSSEQGSSGTIYDGLIFYINDEQQALIGGESDWGEYSFNVPPGIHNFRWVYSKDQGASSGDDCAWLDGIVFPPGSIPPLNINFGDLNSDGTVNVLDVVLTVSSVLGYASLNGEQILTADINMDGKVDVIDLTLIIDMLFAN